MKWSEVLRIAEETGYVFFRHGKLHDAYRHPDREEILYLERHWSKEVKPGLFKRIKKQVGF